MREILFRGKRVDNGEWVYGYYVELKYDGGKLGKCGFIYPCTEADYISVAVDPKTIGQYTGLTDKNGKKIFEGDIIEFLSVDLSNPRIVASVKFGEYENQPLCESCNYSDIQLGYYMQTARGQGSILLGLKHEECIKTIGNVIGNIHDNPELLEVEE